MFKSEQKTKKRLKSKKLCRNPWFVTMRLRNRNQVTSIYLVTKWFVTISQKNQCQTYSKSKRIILLTLGM